ncbi:MAG TPA: AMP-binding protein, partial [Burkholderiales bacterium]|nr:AMP-binding protein [Burkholderiales bacterium]
MSDRPLWTPDPAKAAQTLAARFLERAGKRDWQELYRWSVDASPEFWNLLWDFCEVRGTKGARTLVDGDRMPGAKWFPDARLNYAQNLLRSPDDGEAVVFWAESRVKRRMTRRELHDLVSRMAQALRACGVEKGDRVAGYAPNLPEALAAMLATASLGAIWSSCSPDFGVRGVLDRFGQIEPKVLFCADGYVYGGKEFDSLDKVRDILRGLPSVRTCVVLPYLGRPASVGSALADFIAPFAPRAIEFTPFAFDHPLYILYSSGTTGVPKCIVH